MVKKRITIKEIARESGFSIATVSYVLNDRKDQKIGASAKKKILQIANLYHYRSNGAARSLAMGRSNAVAFYFGNPNSLLAEANAFLSFEKLTSSFEKIGYRTYFVSSKETSSISDVDAIVVVGAEDAFFREIASNNLVPVIALDCLVNDPLFYEISDDFSSYDGTGILISLPLANESYRKYVEAHFKARYVSSSEDLLSSLPPSGVPFFVRDEAIYEYCREHGLRPAFLSAYSQDKIDSLLSCFLEVTRSKEPQARHLFVR
ncbi:MAG: LacI family DNA-binding transcriptional regulator [Bacilli bacterium]|jgi:hypothetical protein|nr:LacI family DNA-binding transcriptional regulator [Bacilli bacterium]